VNLIGDHKPTTTIPIIRAIMDYSKSIPFMSYGMGPDFSMTGKKTSMSHTRFISHPAGTRGSAGSYYKEVLWTH